MVLPYVYKLTNRDTGEFYFGFRSKNVRINLSSSDDIGVVYFTSSKYVKPRFGDFDVEVMAEFFSADDAYSFEQNLIYENIRNPLCLNKHYQILGNRKFKHDVPHREISKKKMSKPRGKINRTAPGGPAWNRGLTKDVDSRVAKLAESRSLAGNDHQIGQKYSDARIEKIRSALTNRKVPQDQRIKMSIVKKGKTWEEIYGIKYAQIKRQQIKRGKDHPNSKKIGTPDGIFYSVNETSQHFKISGYSVRKRCLSKKERWSDWFYIETDSSSTL